MSNLRITLVQERPGQAYYSGSTITGNVLLDLAEWIYLAVYLCRSSKVIYKYIYCEAYPERSTEYNIHSTKLATNMFLFSFFFFFFFFFFYNNSAI